MTLTSLAQLQGGFNEITQVQRPVQCPHYKKPSINTGAYSILLTYDFQ